MIRLHWKAYGRMNIDQFEDESTHNNVLAAATKALFLSDQNQGEPIRIDAQVPNTDGSGTTSVATLWSATDERPGAALQVMKQNALRALDEEAVNVEF